MVYEIYKEAGVVSLPPPCRSPATQQILRQLRKSLYKLMLCIFFISLLVRYLLYHNAVVEEVPTASHAILLWNEQRHSKTRLDKQWGTVQCGCLITSLRNFSARPFDAIVFNADAPYSLQGLDAVQRQPHYLSVFAASQPLSYVDESLHNQAFNLTMTYRRDSDLMWNQYYLSLRRLPQQALAYADATQNGFFWLLMPQREANALRGKLQKKDRFTFYMLYDVNERTYSQSIYLEQLRKHIMLEATDECSVSNNCASYHFMLIFEPTFCPDYMPPDVYVALSNLVVPVLIGGNNITQHVPPGSFIHSRDFDSPAQLAQHLVQLQRKPEMYEQYFSWHLYYDLQHEDQPYCQLCSKIRRQLWHRQTGQQHRSDFRSWWTQRQCPRRSFTATLY